MPVPLELINFLQSPIWCNSQVGHSLQLQHHSYVYPFNVLKALALLWHTPLALAPLEDGLQIT